VIRKFLNLLVILRKEFGGCKSFGEMPENVSSVEVVLDGANPILLLHLEIFFRVVLHLFSGNVLVLRKGIVCLFHHRINHIVHLLHVPIKLFALAALVVNVKNSFSLQVHNNVKSNN